MRFQFLRELDWRIRRDIFQDRLPAELPASLGADNKRVRLNFARAECF